MRDANGVSKNQCSIAALCSVKRKCKCRSFTFIWRSTGVFFQPWFIGAAHSFVLVHRNSAAKIFNLVRVMTFSARNLVI